MQVKWNEATTTQLKTTNARKDLESVRWFGGWKPFPTINIVTWILASFKYASLLARAVLLTRDGILMNLCILYMQLYNYSFFIASNNKVMMNVNNFELNHTFTTHTTHSTHTYRQYHMGYILSRNMHAMLEICIVQALNFACSSKALFHFSPRSHKRYRI